MLRIQNRIKHDNAELLAIIDRCAQIMKEDRLTLRQMIKDNNTEIISLVTTYKKKNDLRLLQQELRKLLNKVKGKQQQQQTQIQFNTKIQKENQVNISQSKTSRTPSRQTASIQKNRNFVSPPKRSLSRQTKQQNIQKQENSPRFNEDIKQNSPNSPEFQFISPNKIEQQRQQLEQFEQKLKQYTQGDNFQKLFDQQEYAKKRDEVVLASFQNFTVQHSEPDKDQNKDKEEDFQQQNLHRRQYSYMSMPKDIVIHQHHNTEIIEIKLQTQSKQEIQQPQENIIQEIRTNIQGSQDGQKINFGKYNEDVQNQIQDRQQEQNEKDKKQRFEQKNDNVYQSQLLDKYEEDEYVQFQNTQNERQQTQQFVATNDEDLYKPIITEDDIMKKYADLFTAPDFLKQCRATCQTQKTIDSFADSRSLNFIVPCQSMVCQDVETTKKGKYQLLSQLTAEQIFDEIFPESTLQKISKAFFRFKMEVVFQQLNHDPSQEELDEMFYQVDILRDGFVDVNEMGQFLDSVCPKQDRQIYNNIDKNNKGYFDEQELSQQSNKNVARLYFQELDLLNTNKITYWEYYLKRTTNIGQQVINLILKNLD
ncbi:unnamed protein product [Paramecium sonneborni]|uniref:EF-hand domain-containing protein n=1 Tax=Paramecium sonneborni TaxID=65129 RepID=A0A8S1LE17_9CILI|nr:unnamed protein product [Paramecium sonneborni]